MYAELTKLRLTMLVLVTAAVGYMLGLPQGVNWIDATTACAGALLAGDISGAAAIARGALGTVDWLELLIVLAGTGLAAGGTSALNQWLEMDRDGAMHRTQGRPLPSGAMSRGEAFLAGAVMIVLGVGLLVGFVNAMAAFLALVTATLYIIVYTPLKVKTTLNTLVGAVCGAIPPLIGWAAAAESLGLGAWLLASILFIWQLPHFLSLAWMYRDDYRRGGFRMLPIVDPDGGLTARIVLLTTLLLLPLGLMLILTLRVRPSGSSHGLIFAATSIALGGLLVAAAIRLYRSRDQRAARTMFLASIVYLPLLLGMLVLDQPRPPVWFGLDETLVASADE